MYSTYAHTSLKVPLQVVLGLLFHALADYTGLLHYDDHASSYSGITILHAGRSYPAVRQLPKLLLVSGHRSAPTTETNRPSALIPTYALLIRHNRPRLNSISPPLQITRTIPRPRRTHWMILTPQSIKTRIHARPAALSNPCPHAGMPYSPTPPAFILRVLVRPQSILPAGRASHSSPNIIKMNIRNLFHYSASVLTTALVDKPFF